MNKSGSWAQRLFAGGSGLIYPDFIGKEAADRVIADAKYKPIDNIANKDYLQVLAYMFRFLVLSMDIIYIQIQLTLGIGAWWWMRDPHTRGMCQLEMI